VKFIESHAFTATRAWGALDIATMNGITVRLHWTDEPYEWHVNDGEEVFAVLDGQVRMDYEEEGQTRSRVMNVGDIFFASVGTAHVAHPLGPARVLVIEKEGTV